MKTVEMRVSTWQLCPIHAMVLVSWISEKLNDFYDQNRNGKSSAVRPDCNEIDLVALQEAHTPLPHCMRKGQGDYLGKCKLQKFQVQKLLQNNLAAVMNSLSLLTSRCCASNPSGQIDLSNLFIKFKKEGKSTQTKEEWVRKTCHTRSKKLFLHLAPNIQVEQNPIRRHHIIIILTFQCHPSAKYWPLEHW